MPDDLIALSHVLTGHWLSSSRVVWAVCQGQARRSLEIVSGDSKLASRHIDDSRINSLEQPDYVVVGSGTLACPQRWSSLQLRILLLGTLLHISRKCAVLYLGLWSIASCILPVEERRTLLPRF